MRVGRPIWSICLSNIVFCLAGCTHGAQPSGQVLAQVGGSEITSSEFQTVIDALPPTVDKASPKLRAAIFADLVNDALLANAATNAGLDKQPAVSRKIDIARMAILAQSYVATDATPNVTRQDEIGFYAAHPAMFAQRKDYFLTDVAIQDTGGDRQYVISLVRQPQARLDEAIAILRKAKRAMTTGHYGVWSDHMPPDLATRLASSKAGALFDYEAGPIVHVDRIDRIVVAPRAFGATEPAIRNAVLMGRVRQQHDARLAEARRLASVSYGPLGSRILADGAASPQTR